MSTAMIVDGQNVLMRSIFAARGTMMSSGGVATGPLLICINSLAKHVREEQPSRLVVAWDGGTSAARRARLPSYKAHRKAVPEDEKIFRDSASALVRRFLALAGLYQIQVTGVEADDLIAGAWANLIPEQADKIVILSSDKDFLQMVGPNPRGIETELVRLSSAGTATDRWDENRVFDELGYAPWNWPLVTALTGDTSDGVPGLRGVGPKKAVKLLEAAEWDMNAVPLTPEQREIVAACFEVVDLRSVQPPVSVPPFRATRPGDMLFDSLLEFLAALEMDSVRDRLRDGSLWLSRDLISVTDSNDHDNGRDE
jgi:5'-3' exonuclease